MPKTILVIDDEPNYQNMMEFLFSSEGFRVLKASSGVEALEILKREEVELIITDMKMPQMDGLDLAKAVKEMCPSMPIVLMTGFSIESRVQEALNINAKACLHKPFSIDEMKEVVHGIL